MIDDNTFFNRPPVQVDLIPGSSFFGIPEGHVKQKMGEFNITGESQMEFEFRTFQKTAFIASVLNGQVCGLLCYPLFLFAVRTCFHSYTPLLFLFLTRDFITNLVEHRTSNTIVTGSNAVGTLNLSIR